jgi:hypothetical protein
VAAQLIARLLATVDLLLRADETPNRIQEYAKGQIAAELRGERAGVLRRRDWK